MQLPRMASLATKKITVSCPPPIQTDLSLAEVDPQLLVRSRIELRLRPRLGVQFVPHMRHRQQGISPSKIV